MHTFLEISNLPRVNQEGENLNSLITTNKIKSVIEKLPTNESPGADAFPGNPMNGAKQGGANLGLQLRVHRTVYSYIIN